MLETILKFITGVGLFLFAIFFIDNNVEKNEKLSLLVKKYTKNPLFTLLFGTLTAAITQSSSAVNGIVAGLRDKDVLEEKTSYLLVAGSNVGTTITAYFAVFQNVAMATVFSSIIFFATISMMLFKKYNVAKIAKFLIGFSLIFISFEFIGASIPDIVKIMNLDILTHTNPMIPFLVCLIVTAICQSSSLVSIIIISFAQLGVLTLDNAIFMIMAANVGTCSTVFIIALGKTKKGLKVAVFNLVLNVIGTLVCFALYYSNMLYWFFRLSVSTDTKIALFHTIFNLLCCVVVCPFLDGYTKINFQNLKQKFIKKAHAR